MLAKHRICGYAQGYQHQTIERTLPVALLPEQLQLLCVKGYAQLCDAIYDITDDELALYEAQKDLEWHAFNTVKADYDSLKRSLHISGREGALIEKPLPPDMLPITSDALPWFRAANRDVKILNSNRFKIFCALWERGYWITLGTKFGGDFLLYHDSPNNVHSDYIVYVFENEPIASAYDILTNSRVATTVNKTMLYCWWAEDKLEALEIKWRH